MNHYGKKVATTLIVLSSLFLSLSISAQVSREDRKELTGITSKQQEIFNRSTDTKAESESTYYARLIKNGFTLKKMLTRDVYQSLFSFIHGGGAYLSFNSGSQAYGYGSDIELSGGRGSDLRLSTGFAGCDFGFIAPLEVRAIEDFLGPYRQVDQTREFQELDTMIVGEERNGRWGSSYYYRLDSLPGFPNIKHDTVIREGDVFLIRSISFRSWDVLAEVHILKLDAEFEDYALIGYKVLKNYPIKDCK